MTQAVALNILALTTLAEMMFAVGLGVSGQDVRGAMRDRGLVARGILANYVLFPGVAIGLLLLFRPAPLVVVGFLILAVCPAGPYGAVYTAIARGNVANAAGLMIILAGMSPLLSPLLLNLLAPLVPESDPVRVDVARMAATLLLGQIAPLLAGLAVQRFRPRAAARLRAPAVAGAKVLNALFLAVVVFVQFDSLLAIRLRGLAGMLLLLVASVCLGWLAGGPGRENRKAMALTTCVRNNGAGLVIATGAFPGTPAVTVAVVYGLIGVLGGLCFALWWSRRDPVAHKEG